MHPRRLHACGSGEMKCSCVFLDKLHRTEDEAEEACWASRLGNQTEFAWMDVVRQHYGSV
jgi:hypothetical protein